MSESDNNSSTPDSSDDYKRTTLYLREHIKKDYERWLRFLTEHENPVVDKSEKRQMHEVLVYVAMANPDTFVDALETLHDEPEQFDVDVEDAVKALVVKVLG